MHNNEQVKQSIRAWLQEDVGHGDVTTLTTIPIKHQSKGIIHAKQQGILCGVKIAELVFAIVDPTVKFEAHAIEGKKVEAGTIIAVAEGSTHSILRAERLALNLMQRLSGIATKTRMYVEAIEGTKVRLTDTRKTTPGHRLLEKYAVRIGGGYNHRFGLFDAVMIKDNHIEASGGIEAAVKSARAGIPHTMKIEVEVETQAQVEQAIQAKADIIMLDNMNSTEMQKFVILIKSKAPHALIEASGGVTLETIKDIALTGVDIISVGGLTTSIQGLDISLDLNDIKI